MYRDTEGVLRWEGKFRTKSNAQTRLSEVLTEIHKGSYSRPSSLNFEQFAKEWLSSRRQLRGSTEAGYSSLIDKQLIPRLGSMKVSSVRFEDIDAAVSGMIEDELASKTIHNAVMLLRNMLAGRKGPSAFRRGLAFADSTLGVKLPPLEYRQIVPPAPEQTWTLIKAAKEIGGVGYPITYLGAFLRNATKRGLGSQVLRCSMVRQ
jgi:hypothetical protein